MEVFTLVKATIARLPRPLDRLAMNAAFNGHVADHVLDVERWMHDAIHQQPDRSLYSMMLTYMVTKNIRNARSVGMILLQAEQDGSSLPLSVLPVVAVQRQVVALTERVQCDMK